MLPLRLGVSSSRAGRSTTERPRSAPRATPRPWASTTSRSATACLTAASASTPTSHPAVGRRGRDDAPAATDLRARRALLSGAGARQPGRHPGRRVRRRADPWGRHRLNPDEFEAVGVPVRERGARVDDHLEAARALWKRRPADFAGPFTTLRAARLGVPPITPGGPPVWVGDTATPRCAGHCGSATAGTAPAPTPPRSRMCAAGCVRSPPTLGLLTQRLPTRERPTA